jgi:hypothetical protein
MLLSWDPSDVFVFACSAEGKGAARIGATSFAFVPLSLANLEEAPALYEHVASRIKERKKGGSMPPGLAEQLEVQLAVLRDESLPDLEIILMPSFSPALCE